MASKGDDVLMELAERAVRILREDYGLAEADAQEAALDITEAMRAEFGGQMVYFKKLSENRDRQIFEEFNGSNQDALCRRYRITLQRLYQIIHTQKAIRRSRA